MCLDHYKQVLHNSIYKQLTDFCPIQKVLVIKSNKTCQYLLNELIQILQLQYQAYTNQKEEYIHFYECDITNTQDYTKQIHQIYNYAQEHKFNQIIDTRYGEQISEQFLYFIQHKQLSAAKYSVALTQQWEQQWSGLEKIDDLQLKGKNYKVKTLNNKIIIIRPFQLIGMNLVQPLLDQGQTQQNILSHYLAINKGNKILIKSEIEKLLILLISLHQMDQFSDLIFDLKWQSKQIEKSGTKYIKEADKLRAKVIQAMKENNVDIAKMYAQQIITYQQQCAKYVGIACQLQVMIGQLQIYSTNKKVVKHVSNLNKVLVNIQNPAEILKNAKIMAQFEELNKEMNITTDMVSEAMGQMNYQQATSQLTAEQLLTQIAQEETQKIQQAPEINTQQIQQQQQLNSTEKELQDIKQKMSEL